MRLLQFARRAPGRSRWRVFFWWTFVRGLVWLFLKFTYRIQCRGREHVPSTGPIIYVSNHQSHFDPPIVGVLVTDRPFSGIARSTLFKSRIFSWIMRGIGSVAIDQSRGDTGAMKASLAELAAGRCLLIFPEGTRTRDGALNEFQRGVTLLIKKSGAPVVPVALEGAFDAWPIGQPFPRLNGRIVVMAGPPIVAAELMRNGPDACVAILKERIETMRLELRAELRRQSGGRFPAAGPGDQRADQCADPSVHQRI